MDLGIDVLIAYRFWFMHLLMIFKFYETEIGLYFVLRYEEVQIDRYIVNFKILWDNFTLFA